jgi:hypothetical protein
MTAAAEQRAGRSESPAAPAAEPLEWSFNPWRERPGLASLALVLVLGACALVASLRESPVLTLGLSLAAVASLSPLFTPTVCRVDGDGVARRGPLGWSRRTWADLRRVTLGAGGLFVSPYLRRTWRDAHRALFLPLPAARSERLLAALDPIVRDHDGRR